MSEPRREISDDELVSSVLDDEATADERARVQADDALHARLEVFTDVQGAVRDVDLPFDPATLRAAALAAWQDEAEPHPVTDLTAVATRRAARRRGGPAMGVAAAAAAVVLAFGAWAGLRGEGGSAGGDEAATASSSAGGSDAATARATPEAAGATGAFATAEAPVPAVDLGAAREVDELARAYRAAFATPSERTDTPPALSRGNGSSAGANATAADATAPPSCVVPAVAQAELAGRRVLLVPGPTEVQVIDAVTCRPVTSFAR